MQKACQSPAGTEDGVDRGARRLEPRCCHGSERGVSPCVLSLKPQTPFGLSLTVRDPCNASRTARASSPILNGIGMNPDERHGFTRQTTSLG